jgi:hypothetical protein
VDNLKGTTPEVGTPSTPEPLPPSNSNLTGNWGWFYQLEFGSIGTRSAEVYKFNQDGTFTLYKAGSSYDYNFAGHTFRNAYETYLKGNYAVSGNKITFSNVQSAGKTVDVNGDANGNGLSYGTRQRAAKVWNSAPTSGYSSIALDSVDYTVLDTNTLGIGVDESYGSDGYYHYDKDWIR